MAQARAPARTPRYPHMLPTAPGQRATVLVALAMSPGTPRPSNAGKVSSVPPPAMELTAPLGNATKELGVRSHLFTDFGTLGSIDEDGPDIADEESIRLSVGFGLSWRSPLGPLRGDIAYPIMKEEYDEDRIFNFNFGTRF